MKAITIHQPWASLIAHGVKTIETRSWRTHYRGRIAIHAAARKPSTRADRHYRWWEDRYKWIGPLGAVVATAQLVDCVPMVDKIPPQDEWLESWSVLALEPWPILTTWPGYGSAKGDGRYASQVHYGDFEPGRWAWLFDDVQPIEPIDRKSVV